MKIAVIKTGGKQYAVSEGKKIRVEKLEGEAGAAITFSEVLLVGEDATAKVGAPYVVGATVEATIVQQGKSRKVTGVKHKAKKRYKMKFGHRQPFTEVKITKVA